MVVYRSVNFKESVVFVHCVYNSVEVTMDKFESCVQPLRNLDHNKFIQTLFFNESDNLEILMKVMNYFRTHVIPVYHDIYEKLQANCILLDNKNKYVIEDFEKMNNATEEVILKLNCLFEKYTFVKQKQLELLERAENLVFEVQKHHRILSDEEQRFYQTLEILSKKVKEYQENIELVSNKKNTLQIHEDQWDNIKRNHYLNDRHMQIVRESLDVNGLAIGQVLDSITSIWEKLNESDLDTQQNCS